MYTLEDFHEQLIQGVYSSAESTGTMREEAFLNEVSTYLIDDADLTEKVQFADYRNTNIGLEVHGYDYDEERGIFTLIVHEFSQSDKIINIGRSTLESKFKRLKKFFDRAILGLYTEMEESSSACEMAYFIYSKKGVLNSVRFFIITDCKIATRTEAEFHNINDNKYKYEYRIFDIDYLYKIFLSQSSDKDYNIDVEKILGRPIECLKAGIQSEDYDSYLLVAPGKLIYDMYDEFGQKLLEQNVRTFLQFKGKVNKGLRITIQKQPKMFFAYNNGLTATAKNIEFTHDKKIKSINGFQIVNGGQTTSAIYATHRNEKASLDDVYVQIKLSVLKNEEMKDAFISKISEYANTQNKVSKSDFFSNSPFHKDFKEHSEKIYAPAKSGALYKTKWFYERARGQYLQSIALLRLKSEQNQFKKEHPKNQVIEKPMLAKSEISWEMHPEIVAKGAETCFASFANNITQKIEKDENLITEYYFKSAVAKIIIFKETEKIVSAASWYDGGYRAQCVTYTIALLAYIFGSNNKNLDFVRIWEKQEIDELLKSFIEVIAEKVYEQLMTRVAGVANIGQYCKKRECWDDIQKLAVNFNDINLINKLAADKEEIRIIKREAKNNQELDSSIKMQEFILKQNKEIWSIIFDNEIKYNHPLALSNTEFGVLQSMKNHKIQMPSPLQAKTLYGVYKKAEKMGLIK